MNKNQNLIQRTRLLIVELITNLLYFIVSYYFYHRHGVLAFWSKFIESDIAGGFEYVSLIESFYGQARREKISERMKILQNLVPGCNKVYHGIS